MDTNIELNSELSLFPQRYSCPSDPNYKVKGTSGLCPSLIPCKCKSAVIKCGK